MKSRETCLALLTAESEAAALKILEGTPEMANPKNWRPLDNRETNFNVTSNQASDGGKALTELMTNMVDAVLMKYAYTKGIDPKGKAAPKTMYEAVDTLIHNMQGGKLVNLDPKDPWLRDFASKNLVIGITGAKNKKEGLPCYTFVDNGEGQNGGDFPRTFLSLSEGNKRSIDFVQGKYNMGSSGVLGYCGRRWFKLILSRRYDRKSTWGWTLMRKRPGDGMPVAEYFVLPDGTIPQFEESSIFPFVKGDGNRYDGMMLSSGTIIKLYDYQVGARYLSFRGAREALNENLVETILPFRLLDFRQKPDKKRGGDRAEGIDPRPFYGMEFLLLNSHNEGKTEDAADEDDDPDEADDENEVVAQRRIAVGSVKHPELGEITITAIALKRAIPSWLRAPNNNRVFHAVNGQVQFKQTRGYLTDCGYPALKDRIVVIVDASRLSFAAHNDVWKGDREHTRNTVIGELYKEQITATIKESDALKALQQEIAREELDRAKTDEGNDLFQKLIDADRNLVGLLTNDAPVIRLPSGGGVNGSSQGSGEFKEGKYSPTFIKIDPKAKANIVDIPINRSRPIGARTDAENGYLNRPDNAGRVIISDAVASKFGIRPHLLNGRLTVFLTPIESASRVGDVINIRIELKDDAMAQSVRDEFAVRIIDEETPQQKPKKAKSTGSKPPPKAGDKADKSGGDEEKPTHGLPGYRLLTADGRAIGGSETIKWPDAFSETDGGYAEDLGDNQILYYINYDNAYHIRYRQQQKGDLARDAVTEKYILGMRILMLSFENSIRTVSRSSEEGIGEFFDSFRKMSAKAAAATVLALAEILPKIVDSGPAETE
jgi:hypothetical protein